MNSDPTKETGQLLLIPAEQLRGEMRTIPLEALPDSETHGSRRPSASMIESVRRFGVLTPILVSPATQRDSDVFKDSLKGGKQNDIKYKLLAGRRRVLAAREVGFLFLQAVIFPYGVTPTQAVTLLENEQRSENPLVELEQIEAVIRAGGTLDQICEATGMDTRRAEARMRLANLIPELRALLVANKLAVGVAEDAARLNPTEQSELYRIAQENSGRIRGKDVTGIRRVNAASASASLPSAMFSGGVAPGSEEDDGNDPDRPVHTASGTLPNGLTVALNAPPVDPYKIFLAVDYGHALLIFLNLQESLPPKIADIRLALTDFMELHGISPEAPQMTADAPSGDSADTLPVGVKGTTIKPDSAARAERRRKAKEAKTAVVAGNETPEETSGEPSDETNETDLDEEPAPVQPLNPAPTANDFTEFKDPFDDNE